MMIQLGLDPWCSSVAAGPGPAVSERHQLPANIYTRQLLHNREIVVNSVECWLRYVIRFSKFHPNIRSGKTSKFAE